MEITKIRLGVDLSKKIACILAVIGFIFYTLGMKSSAYIMAFFIILSLIIYIILCLVYWKCPYCHQYLPTKKVMSIKECPHCHKKIK